MTPKTIKCVDHEKQDTFSCKHENTLKSMEFSKGDKQLCLLTVHVGTSIWKNKESHDYNSQPLIVKIHGYV